MKHLLLRSALRTTLLMLIEMSTSLSAKYSDGVGFIGRISSRLVSRLPYEVFPMSTVLWFLSGFRGEIGNQFYRECAKMAAWTLLN